MRFARTMKILTFLGAFALMMQITGKETIKFKDLVKITKKEPFTCEFDIKDAETRQIRLHLDVRYDWDSLFGYTNGMEILVNGKKITGSRLLNKPSRFKTRNGGGSLWAGPHNTNFNIMYSPDFSDKIQTDKSFKYGLFEKEQQPYTFVFDLTGMTQHTGINKVKILATYSAALIAKNIRLEIDEKAMPRINDPASLVKPAPKGPLQDYQLKALPVVDLQVKTDSKGQIVIKSFNNTFTVKSKFSLPNGKWLEFGRGTKLVKRDKEFILESKTSQYSISRKICIEDNRVKVFDTFKNLRSKVTGVMFENSLELPEKPSKVLRGGIACFLDESRNVGNPSITAKLKENFVALLCEDDILRNQAYYKHGEKSITFGDRNLGLPAGKSYTLEWCIYVLPKSNYYDFVNVVRKDWNSCFKWEGPLAFPYMGGRQLQKWNKKHVKAETVRNYLKKKPVNLLMTHVASNIKTSPAKATREVPWLGHGTAILEFNWWTNMTREMIRAFDESAPEVKVFVYMHKNICSESKNWEKYRDSLPMDAYSQALIKKHAAKGYGRFIPTAKNSYGKQLKKVYEFIIDDLKGNIYMDEICLSVTDWAPNKEWDNCTVEIDKSTHKIKRKISIPNLLSKPWLEGMLKHLKKNNKQLLANGPLATRTLTQHHFMHFIEYGMGASGLIESHFSSPLAWNGYEMGMPGYKHLRESMDYGALAITWSGPWSDHLFPFTPLEIRPGYLIGKERIVTKKSGRFGWDDKSQARFFVYDGNGKLVSDPNVKTISANNKTVYDIRMPSNYFAVIERLK